MFNKTDVDSLYINVNVEMAMKHSTVPTTKSLHTESLRFTKSLRFFGDFYIPFRSLEHSLALDFILFSFFF